MRQNSETSVAVENSPPAGNGFNLRPVTGSTNGRVDVASRPLLSALDLYVLARRWTCDGVGQKVVSLMPSGSNSRRAMKSSYGIPLTTSMMRPTVLMPGLLYSNLLPGSNFKGDAA